MATGAVGWAAVVGADVAGAAVVTGTLDVDRTTVSEVGGTVIGVVTGDGTVSTGLAGAWVRAVVLGAADPVAEDTTNHEPTTTIAAAAAMVARRCRPVPRSAPMTHSSPTILGGRRQEHEAQFVPSHRPDDGSLHVADALLVPRQPGVVVIRPRGGRRT
jgi:hypothetical protein